MSNVAIEPAVGLMSAVGYECMTHLNLWSEVDGEGVLAVYRLRFDAPSARETCGFEWPRT